MIKTVLDDYFYEKKTRSMANFGHAGELCPAKIEYSELDEDTIQFQVPSNYVPTGLYMSLGERKNLFLLMHDGAVVGIPDSNEDNYLILYSGEYLKNGILREREIIHFKYLPKAKNQYRYLAEFSFTDEDGFVSKIVRKNVKIPGNPGNYFLIKHSKKELIESLVDHFVQLCGR
jgi:hypothetical protein